MSAKVLDGKLLAGVIKEKLAERVRELKKSTGTVPHLVNVMIGNEPASCSYAKAQERTAKDLGIQYALKQLALTITQDKLIDYIEDLNKDPLVHGIMLHKPFPQSIDYQTVADHIDSKKDLEGISASNIGRVLLEESHILPCTPAAVMELIKSTDVPLRGKEAVIVGASEIVGKPLSLLLLQEFLTVTVCHIATSQAGRLQEHVAKADILVVAVGKANLIPGAWVKTGSIVIDVGINKVKDKMVGDVDFEAAKTRASYITPVPGGVGPVTVVMLMRNGIEAYKEQNGIK